MERDKECYSDYFPLVGKLFCGGKDSPFKSCTRLTTMRSNDKFEFKVNEVYILNNTNRIKGI